MGFKLGSEIRQYRTPKDTPIVRKKLDKGILGEANNDGTINIDSSVKPGSAKEKEVVAHEEVHMKDMKSGKLAYGDNWIRYRGKTYPRKGGKIKYDGKWKPEGDSKFPWEKAANKSNESKSALKSHNDINPGDPGFMDHHIKNNDGDWVPMSGQQEAKYQNIKKLMPEMSSEAIHKILKSSANDPDAMEKIKKRKEEIKEN